MKFLKQKEIIKSDSIIVVDVNRLFTAIDFLWNAEIGDCVKINYTRNGVQGSATSTPLTAENFIDVN